MLLYCILDSPNYDLRRTNLYFGGDAKEYSMSSASLLYIFAVVKNKSELPRFSIPLFLTSFLEWVSKFPLAAQFLDSGII